MQKALRSLNLLFTLPLVLASSVYAAGPYASRDCKPNEQKTDRSEVEDDFFGVRGFLGTDAQLVQFMHEHEFKKLSLDDVACWMGVKLPSPPRKLGPIDKWRYDSCRTDATKAPTPMGVNQAMQICREKFEQ